MKKIITAILLLSLALTAGFLTACGGGDDDDTDKPSDKRELLFDGENYTVFGKTANNSFDVIYASSETSTMAEIAIEICNKIEAEEFPKPRFYADNDKDESTLEFLIGDTSRALSAEAKAIVEANADPTPTICTGYGSAATDRLLFMQTRLRHTRRRSQSLIQNTLRTVFIR